MAPKKAAAVAAAPKPPKVDTSALQRARMQASFKMKKAGDAEREKLYAEQWAKGGPDRRLTKKSAPRARDAKPQRNAVNQREAEIVRGMTERSAGHVIGVDPSIKLPILEALFAKDIAKRAQKHGVSAASATAMATVLGMNLGRLAAPADDDLYR